MTPSATERAGDPGAGPGEGAASTDSVRGPGSSGAVASLEASDGSSEGGISPGGWVPSRIAAA
jgi:hypothetical protein